jgi:hypothetical protein
MPGGSYLYEQCRKVNVIKLSRDMPEQDKTDCPAIPGSDTLPVKEICLKDFCRHRNSGNILLHVKIDRDAFRVSVDV